jgi:hypothetical protein
MTAGFAEKDAHIQSAYNNITSEISGLSANTSQNFNYTWGLIQSLNNSISGGGSNDNQILSYLANLTSSMAQMQQQITNVNTTINNNILSINQSLGNQISLSANTTITQINALNTTTQAGFDAINSYLANLSLQVGNITQANITQLADLLLAINSSLSQSITNLNVTMLNQFNVTNTLIQEINQSLTTINTNIIYINQTTTFILQELNISTIDLNLFVQASPKCLYNTNWLATAQVRDRFGNLLSPIDSVNCQMTTDLWATTNMTYSYLEHKWKYTHQCDSDNTTFAWAVDCVRI